MDNNLAVVSFALHGLCACLSLLIVSDLVQVLLSLGRLSVAAGRVRHSEQV